MPVSTRMELRGKLVLQIDRIRGTVIVFGDEKAERYELPRVELLEVYCQGSYSVRSRIEVPEGEPQ